MEKATKKAKDTSASTVDRAQPGEFNPLKSASAYSTSPSSWFKEDTSSGAASMLTCLLDTLRGERTYVQRRNRRAIELYGNVECGNLSTFQYMTDTDVDGVYQYNLVESIVDTVQAEVISNRTRPQFFTDGGDWESKEKARELTSYISGVFSDNDIYNGLSPSVCLDALVFGTGFAKVWEEEGKIKIERCFPPEVIVDDVEASLSNNKPRNMYYSRYLPRGTVEAIFSEDNKKLELIKGSTGDDFKQGAERTHVDILSLTEAWHLPDGKSKGRHMILCGNTCILDEDYKQKYFPFVVLRYKDRVRGYLGKGIPEILEGQQELINDLRDKINAQVLGSSPFIWTAPGSKLTESEISNRIWRVIESETPPQYIANNSIPPDLMARFQQEVSEAGTLVGANTLMLRSELPPGIQSGSGRALRIYNDTKSKRFMKFARAYEQMHIDLANLIMDVSAYAEECGTNIETVYEAGGVLKKMSYSEIAPKNDLYIIRPEPINFLSDTPSGRLSDIEALASIFPEDMKSKLVRLLDNPDVQGVTSYLSANDDAISKAFSAILRGEKTSSQVAPNQYMDLPLCLQMGKSMILSAMTQGAPPERLLELENWLEMAKILKDRGEEEQRAKDMRQAAEQQAAMAAMAPAPPGAEMGGMPPGAEAPLPPGPTDIAELEAQQAILDEQQIAQP